MRLNTGINQQILSVGK